MRIYLTLSGDTVTTARFETYGCPYAIACGDWTATWAAGKSVALALALEPGDLILLIGGLPLGKEHCAGLAVMSLRNAIARWQEQDRREEGRGTQRVQGKREQGRSGRREEL